MGAENVFCTLNIQRLLSYSKQILICETFFFSIYCYFWNWIKSTWSDVLKCETAQTLLCLL